MTTPEQSSDTAEFERPYDPPPVFKPHPDEPGGFNHWTEVTGLFGDAADDSDTSAHAQGGASSSAQNEVPRVFTAKFKSSSRQAEILIHDPISALLALDEQGTITTDIGNDLVREDMPVSTHVINHHRTLAKKIIRAVALIDDQSVGITIHKQEN